MKSKLLLFTSVLIVGALFMGTTACSKDDAENTTECITESLTTSIKHQADAENPKIITWSVDYAGEHPVKSVKWTFGDGKTETSNGSTITHTYAAADSYEVKAVIYLTGLDCSFNKEKSVTVE